MSVCVLLLAVAFALYLSKKEKPVKGALEHIRERGHLKALTEKNTLDYFIYRGAVMGYQFDLLNHFAKYLGIPLKMMTSNSVARLCYYLEYRAADILAMNLPITRFGKKLIHYTNPLGSTRLVLVQRTKFPSRSDMDAPYIYAISNFEHETIIVQRNIFMKPLLDQFLNEMNGRVVILEKEETQENLVKMVSERIIDFTLCPENLAIVLAKAYKNLDVSVSISDSFQYAWGVHHHSDTLLEIINYWLDSVQKPKAMRKIYREYYSNPRVVNHFRSNYFSLTGKSLSPYDSELKTLSKKFWWDWKLVASLMYEESNFREGQVSRRNASGLMQMIPETAELYNLDSSSTAAHQIEAGIKYLKWIDKQLPPEITDPKERVNFTLAAYNVGIGRVLALRNKAAKYGKDPNQWTGNVEYYLLKRSKHDPYGSADTISDFPIDYSLGGYVDGIVNRYYHYRNLIPQ